VLNAEHLFSPNYRIGVVWPIGIGKDPVEQRHLLVHGVSGPSLQHLYWRPGTVEADGRVAVEAPSLPSMTQSLAGSGTMAPGQGSRRPC